MLDREGYRPNVGIILCNAKNEVFWASASGNIPGSFRKVASNGAKPRKRPCFGNCTRKSACFRSTFAFSAHPGLVALRSAGAMDQARMARQLQRQKQIWFLLRLVGRDSDVSLRASNHPEFDAWRWNSYWVPLDVVIEFKRGVYEQALSELARFIDADRKRTRGAFVRRFQSMSTAAIRMPGSAEPMHVMSWRISAISALCMLAFGSSPLAAKGPADYELLLEKKSEGTNFDDRPWVEIEAILPAAPQQANLLPIDVNQLSDNRFFRR